MDIVDEILLSICNNKGIEFKLDSFVLVLVVKGAYMPIYYNHPFIETKMIFLGIKQSFAVELRVFVAQKSWWNILPHFYSSNFG